MENIMNKSLKIVLALIVGTLILFTGRITINAASFNVSAPGTVSPGQTFNVSITATNMYANFSVSVSGPGVLNSAPTDADNGTVSASVTATGPGRITVSVSGVGSDYDNPSDVAVSGSASINVVAPSSGGSGGSSGGSSGSSNATVNTPKEESTNVNLSLGALSVSEGTLTPSFSPDITEYTVKLPKKSRKIKIDAALEATGVSIEGVGEHSLKDGNNKISIITKPVEGGDGKTYIINVYVEESPEIFLNGPSDKKLGIISLTSAPVLDGFEDYKLKISGKEVLAKRNPVTKLVLLYMEDSKSNKNYYIFDEKEKKVTSIYIPVSLLGNNYAIVTIPDELRKMEGMSFKKIKVSEQEFEGWVFEDKAFKNYSLIYLMDNKAEKHLYQYEATTNTLQLYSGAAAATQESYNKMSKDVDLYKTLTFVFVGATAILGVSSIVFGINLAKKKKIKL